MANTSSLYKSIDLYLGGRLDEILLEHDACGSSIDSVWRDLTLKGVTVSKQTVSNWMARL